MNALRLHQGAKLSHDFQIAIGQLLRNAVTADQANAARAAHLQFGKGTGHRAALNYGDCFAYALARTMEAPVLCKGNDFKLTDIAIA